ncbi:MAG TPA: thiamine phosphate synthase [Planctomycetota bacterium]|jgi:thiamine-phosphate pyrophosphorylase|nr:thiamine phosphate synthase [Planctomycetota bacterium]OQC22066.1 MAG: Thiamine-phosphate synthase [Planctomycetes bacterium ADurb.Bin069]HNR98051.1 thiamine phosphate synthase [Planctomycetota bacterium]HNU25800.1 thiamine phosphate synthase [Planctomycetota bacterium]HOE28646.1 thiamine phosphate synthase [Planctomycetota bacterium]
MDPKVDFKLYAIGDRAACAPRLLALVLKQAVQTGLRAVQVREKDLAPDALYRLAEDVQRSVGGYGAKVLINDRADIAAAVGAAGVHLTERSMPVAAARRILGDAAVIGVSAHTAEAVEAAAGDGADFVVFGPVFQTASHPEAAPVGLMVLERVTARVKLPVFAVGGIRPETAAQCLAAGARGVAVRGAVVGAASVRSAVRAFKAALGGL